MITSFWYDLQIAKTAEEEVISALSNLAPDIEFINVSNDKEYFYKGDIKAILPDGRCAMIEVKRDTRIGDTHNILCQEAKKYWDKDYWQKGTMHSDYEIYAIVSPQRRRVCFIDFKVLFAHYKEGKHKVFITEEAAEDIYLLPLEYLEEQGGIIATVDYENNIITYKNPSFNYGERQLLLMRREVAACLDCAQPCGTKFDFLSIFTYTIIDEEDKMSSASLILRKVKLL